MDFDNFDKMHLIKSIYKVIWSLISNNQINQFF